jgi:diacylglycerol kinase (ATP)
MKRAQSTWVSFKTALSGLLYAFKTQKNLRIGAGLACLVLLFSLVLRISLFEFAIIILSIFLFFSAEMINTSIEEVVDLLTNKWEKQAKIAKDVASGMVLVVVIGVALIGFLIFGSRLTRLLLPEIF